MVAVSGNRLARKSRLVSNAQSGLKTLGSAFDTCMPIRLVRRPFADPDPAPLDSKRLEVVEEFSLADRRGRQTQGDSQRWPGHLPGRSPGAALYAGQSNC